MSDSPSATLHQALTELVRSLQAESDARPVMDPDHSVAFRLHAPDETGPDAPSAEWRLVACYVTGFSPESAYVIEDEVVIRLLAEDEVELEFVEEARTTGTRRMGLENGGIALVVSQAREFMEERLPPSPEVEPPDV